MEKRFVVEQPEVLKVLKLAQDSNKVGFDIECEGLENTARISGFSLYIPEHDLGVYIPLVCEHPEYAFERSKEDTLQIMQGLSKIKAVTYNGSFDVSLIEFQYGIRVPLAGDGNLISKMFQLHKFGLKDPLALELGIINEPIKLYHVLGEGNYNFVKAPLNQLTLDYTVQDAYCAYKVEEALVRDNWKPEKYPSFNQVYNLELQVLPVLGLAERQGMLLDVEKFSETARQMAMEADDLHQEICNELNRDPLSFNIGSSQRLSCALFNKTDRVPEPLPPKKPRARKEPEQDDRDLPGLGLEPGSPPSKTGKFEQYSVANIELERISSQHPVIGKIMKWKSLNSVLTKDVPHVHEWAPNGRIYPQFEQLGEDGTSRIYTGKPNVISMSYAVRDAMPPAQNKVYVHVDYQAAEWRLAGLLSGETRILEELDSGRDPHKATFAFMSSVDPDKVTKEQRATGKVLNYAALFGSTGYSLARSLKCSEAEARDLSNKFWAAYPYLSTWRQKRHDYAMKHARTHTVIGRVRRLPGIFSKQQSLVKEELRRSVNTATQGSCGDVLKIALINFDKMVHGDSILAKYKARFVCPAFDAALIEMDATALNDKDNVEQGLRDAFEVELDCEGRKTRMKIDIAGWSTDSWKAAMGK